MNPCQKYFILGLLIASIGFAKAVQIESVVLPNTQIRKIHSKFTGQNYRIYINVPATYKVNSSKKYPSLFMLDADYSFALAKQITEHLSDRKRIPETLVFGVAYDGPPNYRLNRTRDYTPTRVLGGGYGPEFEKHSGGAPQFADFLEKELVPFLKKEFKLSDSKTLVGHSYGGLFSAWMLISRPKIFESYIIVSPSLWYDHGFIFKQKQPIEEIKGKAFFGVGSRETTKYNTEHPMLEETQRFARLLESKKSSDFKVAFVVFADENHDTVFPAALTRGIAFVLGKKLGLKAINKSVLAERIF
ncbi:MAG: alpha/beta hydrolase-fold protein [Myxococcota bacterium]